MSMQDDLEALAAERDERNERKYSRMLRNLGCENSEITYEILMARDENAAFWHRRAMLYLAIVRVLDWQLLEARNEIRRLRGGEDYI
jgi:hypothetical protein